MTWLCGGDALGRPRPRRRERVTEEGEVGSGKDVRGPQGGGEPRGMRSVAANCARTFVTGEDGVWRGWEGRCAKRAVAVAGMDITMSSGTRQEVLKKLRRRYQGAGPAYRRKLIDQAVEVLGYHRKSAIRALGSTGADRIRPADTGRPRRYEAGKLTPWLRPIWQATDYACGRRLAAMLPEWIPAYEAHEQSLPGEVRERLLEAREVKGIASK